MTGVVYGFKGFNKDLKCSGHQFEIGKEHIHDGEVKLCSRGFHFCEYPLDVFGYYAPASSRFAEVEATDVSNEKYGDSKRVCKRLVIKAEVSFRAMVKAAVKFTFDRADWSNKEKHVIGKNDGAIESKYQGAASATGDRGAASATGYQGAASATFYVLKHGKFRVAQ